MEKQVGAKKLKLIQGDITSLACDAIVNAANSALQLGAGVAGAIRSKGGPTIQKECDRIGGCPVGDAVITGAGDLPCRYVIHAVGPRMGEGEEDAKLDGAAKAALLRASEQGLRSIALPAISTGIFGFPLERAADILLRSAIEHLQGDTAIEEISFCLYSDNDYAMFVQRLKETIP
ncbi:MAG: O-acetyl-ADP-ribose deacetylase [Desulfuromonas sp.]|nr:MAG: O-acetyl-ADP-ribose deacetylase [Desulfuromonas sp.]